MCPSSACGDANGKTSAHDWACFVLPHDGEDGHTMYLTCLDVSHELKPSCQIAFDKGV